MAFNSAEEEQDSINEINITPFVDVISFAGYFYDNCTNDD